MNNLKLERDGNNFVLRDEIWYLVCWEKDGVSLELFFGFEDELQWVKPEPITGIPLWSDNRVYASAPVPAYIQANPYGSYPDPRMQCCCELDSYSNYSRLRMEMQQQCNIQRSLEYERLMSQCCCNSIGG